VRRQAGRSYLAVGRIEDEAAEAASSLSLMQAAPTGPMERSNRRAAND
jgi:hypothetical protein